MRRSKNLSAMKLIEKFDKQLRDILMSELRLLRSSKNQIITQMTFQNDQEDLMIA